MAKQAGMGDNFYIAGFNLSGDIGSIDDVGGGNEPLVVTGIDKFGFERLGGLRSGRASFSSWFNDTTGQEHDALAALPTANVIVSYWRGTTLGGPAASMVAKQINYDPTRDADGSLSFSIEAQSNAFGLEWGNDLSAGVATQSGVGSLTGVDFGAASAFGLQAYLHVFAFTGTDVTIKVQESQNDGGADPYADVAGGTFVQVTAAPGAQRLATSASLAVERWLRVTTTTTGGFSALSFAVMVVRNATATVF